MHYTTNLLILLVCSTLVSIAQPSSDQIYTSHQEQQFFESYETKQAFGLLYTIDQEPAKLSDLAGDQATFYQFLASLDKKTAKKKRIKRMALIYEGIHERYFDKYVENPVFHDIFDKREYNCVTATALYSLAMEYLDIPYVIREAPTHVYLIVYPGTDRIMFETTTPADGYSTISKRRVEAYRKYMISNKLITEKEANSHDFFSAHVLGDSAVSLQELIGIQYYNNSLIYGEAEMYNQAIDQAGKALTYYDKPYIKALLNVYLIAC